MHKSRLAPKTLPPRDHLCFAIYSAFHAFTSVYKMLLDPLGLTYPQYLVLLVLWERDKLSVGEICLDLGLTTGTLTPVLKRLEEQGLISRERSKSDERKVDINLTASGRALENRAEMMHSNLVCMTKLNPEEIRDLMVRVIALRENLVEMAGAPIVLDAVA